MKGSKIYFKTIFIIAISTIVVLLLRSMFRGSVGNWIVSFLQKAFLFAPSEAQYIYQLMIRNKLDYIIIAAIGVCVIILSAVFVFYSQRQKAKAEKQLEQRKNELITYLAHDIKTPLTSIIGYLNLLNDTPDMSSTGRMNHIGIALEKAYRLEELVNQFFEITQYNLQTVALSKKSIDLYYMLMQLTDEVYPLLAQYKKETVIIADENLTIYGDPDKLARAFNNILKNAAIYGDYNSVIEITATIKGDIVTIKFRNAGSIPANKLTSIFDKFNRLDDARSSNTGGAGLGLAIAREIISLHGGEICAESDNGYTNFIVRFPTNSC